MALRSNHSRWRRHSLPGASKRYAASTNRTCSQRVPLRLGGSRLPHNPSSSRPHHTPSTRHHTPHSLRRPSCNAGSFRTTLQVSLPHPPHRPPHTTTPFPPSPPPPPH